MSARKMSTARTPLKLVMPKYSKISKMPKFANVAKMYMPKFQSYILNSCSEKGKNMKKNFVHLLLNQKITISVSRDCITNIFLPRYDEVFSNRSAAH